jgi:hypothetical protein
MQEVERWQDDVRAEGRARAEEWDRRLERLAAHRGVEVADLEDLAYEAVVRAETPEDAEGWLVEVAEENRRMAEDAAREQRRMQTDDRFRIRKAQEAAMRRHRIRHPGVRHPGTFASWRAEHPDAPEAHYRIALSHWRQCEKELRPIRARYVAQALRGAAGRVTSTQPRTRPARRACAVSRVPRRTRRVDRGGDGGDDPPPPERPDACRPLRRGRR